MVFSNREAKITENEIEKRKDRINEQIEHYKRVGKSRLEEINRLVRISMMENIELCQRRYELMDHNSAYTTMIGDLSTALNHDFNAVARTIGDTLRELETIARLQGELKFLESLEERL